MSQAPSRRLAGLDVARGLAVLAMFAFHFVWDLGHFGYIDATIPYSRSVKFFGHAIAFSFLFIAGVSLVLAQDAHPQWPRFWRRLAIIGGGAALVTVGTYIVFPAAFVFFGILHCIAVSSLLAMIFVSSPWPVAAVAAAAALLAPTLAANPFFDAPPWWWTGLSTFEPATNDYRPLLPWVGAMLAGVAATNAFKADLARTAAAPTTFAAIAPMRAVTFLGRHSLLLYLLHQPLFFAAFSAAALVAAAPTAAETQSFAQSCEAQCLESGAKIDICRGACACTADEVAQRRTLSNVADESERAQRIGEIARECFAKR
jgi:uncharacterized membrane protein